MHRFCNCKLHLFVESMFFGIKMFACFNVIRILLHPFCGRLVVSWIMFLTFQHTGFFSRSYTQESRLHNYYCHWVVTLSSFVSFRNFCSVLFPCSILIELRPSAVALIGLRVQLVCFREVFLQKAFLYCW